MAGGSPPQCPLLAVTGRPARGRVQTRMSLQIAIRRLSQIRRVNGSSGQAIFN
jgi:hypothetical protein